MEFPSKTKPQEEHFSPERSFDKIASSWLVNYFEKVLLLF